MPRAATVKKIRPLPDFPLDTHPEVSIDFDRVKKFLAKHGYKRPVLLVDLDIVRAKTKRFRAALPRKAYEEAGIGPEDVSLAEVYDLSTALELDWIEDLQLCPRGEAAALLRSGATRVGGRTPLARLAVMTQ